MSYIIETALDQTTEQGKDTFDTEGIIIIVEQHPYYYYCISNDS